MQSIVKDFFNFYDEIKFGKYQWVNKQLDSLGIEIISSFLDNKNNIELFYNKYVVSNSPKVVICGINPGRYGAGKTGIPFVDFSSLSKLIEGIDRIDNEKSAEYFYSVIQHFGNEKFYSQFYVTNISCIGFVTKNKPIKNVNYYDLPSEIQEVLFDNFVNRMNIINPTHIISCSKEVSKTLKILKNRGKIASNIELELNHPFFCAIKNNTAKEYKRYIDTLSKVSNY